MHWCRQACWAGDVRGAVLCCRDGVCSAEMQGEPCRSEVCDRDEPIASRLTCCGTVNRNGIKNEYNSNLCHRIVTLEVCGSRQGRTGHRAIERGPMDESTWRRTWFVNKLAKTFAAVSVGPSICVNR